MAKTQKQNSKSTKKAAGSNGHRDLVIVESPAKAKTINKYLGSGFVVKASKGHIRDLPPHNYGIDPGRNFEPTYVILPSQKKIVDELKKLADKAKSVYLATDLDREGEAIAWHLVRALELPESKIKRVVFNEITQSAITEAFAHAHPIDTGKVDAQQARRILDRIVGYELSPLLWKKIAKGLSAGRVQSVAVRLIVMREEDVRSYEPQEHWEVSGIFSLNEDGKETLSKQWLALRNDKEAGSAPPTLKERYAWLAENQCLEAQLSEVSEQPFKPQGRIDRSKPEDKRFTTAADEVRPLAESFGLQISSIESRAWKEYKHLGLCKVRLVWSSDLSSAPKFTVKSVTTKRTQSKPAAPFTTATLQQVASNYLRMPTARTMRIAQELYEGIDIKTGEGNVGLITYMRTDSRILSKDSIHSVRGWIGEQYGEKYLPTKPNYYASGKKAQEAHEAIRPTDVSRTPDAMRGHMSAPQLKLYTLIWNRFVACQMAPAQWDATTVQITAMTSQGEAIFKTSGRVLVFDAFYKVTGIPNGGDAQRMPSLEIGQRLWPLEIIPTQKFSAPPPRYTEASLVKTLEGEGIGRPSTYAAIIKTIQDRGYVEQTDRKFYPTARGEIVIEKLVNHFPKIMDIRFTSNVEDELDKIEEKQLNWHDVLHEFYEPFKESLARAHEEMEPVRAEPSEYVCEDCKKPLVYRLGKNGRFLSCTGYPDCTFTRNVDKDGKLVQPIKVDLTCKLCSKQMVLRKSRLGPFLGCSGYPECTSTVPCMEDGTPLKLVKAEDIKVSCPECSSAMSVKFARGRSFLGCSKYPTCKATAPMPEGVYVARPKPQDAGARCDKCGRKMVIRKSRRGPFLSCSGFPKCRNAMPTDKLEHLKQLEADGKIPDAPVESVNGKGNRGSGNSGKKQRARNLTKEEIAALGPPPAGFAWTRTGRPVIEILPKDSLKCFECGDEMTLRDGRFGPFFSCNSSRCRAVANLRGEAKKQTAENTDEPARSKPIETETACPDCGKMMLLRMGRTGRFLGCSGYPKCRKTMEPPPGLLREKAKTA